MQVFNSCLCLVRPDWTARVQSILWAHIHRTAGRENGTALNTSGITFWETLPLKFPLPAAAAESLQSCLTLCDPIDSSPPGSFIPGILQARTLEWVAISLSNARK